MIFDYAAQPKEHITSCNLCGGHAFEQTASKDRYDLPVTVVKCKACTLEFINPRMTQEAYTEFYRSGTYRRLLEGFYGHPFAPKDLEEEQWEYAARLVKYLAPHVEGRKYETLLDIGGSTGVVAHAVSKAFGLDATVLEPCEAEAARAAERGLKVVHEPLDPQWMIDDLDVVLICQTVDHLTDIASTLSGIFANLLFVDIVENGPYKVDHPYYLTRATMRRYLEQSGWTVVDCSDAGDGLHVNFLVRS